MSMSERLRARAYAEFWKHVRNCATCRANKYPDMVDEKHLCEIGRKLRQAWKEGA